MPEQHPLVGRMIVVPVIELIRRRRSIRIQHDDARREKLAVKSICDRHQAQHDDHDGHGRHGLFSSPRSVAICVFCSTGFQPVPRCVSCAIRHVLQTRATGVSDLPISNPDSSAHRLLSRIRPGLLRRFRKSPALHCHEKSESARPVLRAWPLAETSRPLRE